MKLIIDISEQDYELACKHPEILFGAYAKCIKNGKKLPEGKLINADDLRCERADFDTYHDYCVMFDEIDYAPSIIESDEAESEETDAGSN